MNNKYIKSGWVRYALLIVFGIFLGWLFFYNSSDKPQEVQHVHKEGTTWTCSMHPQIRQSEPGKCPLCGMDLIPASGSSSVEEKDPYLYEMSPEAIALSNIRTTRVESASGENVLTLTGKIQVNEQQLATIAATFPGRIEKLYINFTGEEVKKGQRLASIYSPELITAQKELIEAAKIKDSNNALYNAAREKLRAWRINEKQLEAIERRGEVISNFDIYSHVSGIVTSRNVAEGDYVGRGTTLFEVTNLSKLWVLLDAYESDLSRIQIGSTINFTVPAIPGKESSAKVTYIDPVINPQTRAASVRAEIDNPDGTLKPEMFVRANIKTTSKGNGQELAIPKSALLWTGKRSVVYVKVPNKQIPTFEMREVTLGSGMGEMYQVEQGLSAGEEVVTNGVFTVDAAAQLSGNYSMMERPKMLTVVPDQFQHQLSELVTIYFDLKNALVASDAKQASSNSKQFQNRLEEIDGKILKDNSQEYWMQLKESMLRMSKDLHSTANLEQQRQKFQALSDNMIEAVEKFGIQQDEAYKAYCPMAKNDKGAFWLSEVEEIQNPYYGEAMLTCGEVQKTYNSGTKLDNNRGNSQQYHQH